MAIRNILKSLLFFLFFLPSLLIADWKEELKQKVKQKFPPTWMLEQIEEDLAPFKASGITKKMLDDTMSQAAFAEKAQLVRIEIKKNKVIVKSDNQTILHPRLKDLKGILRSLTKCAKLPDVDFIISLHDSVTDQEQDKLKAPVLVFAKDINKDLKSILIPDLEALSGNYHLPSQIKAGIQNYPWENKENLAFWRGAMTGGMFTLENFLFFPRSQLVSISLKNPLLVNAKFNAVTQTEKPEKLKVQFEEYFGDTLSITDHFRYKYQILIDGNSCAYSRAYWQIFSNCVIFKQTSDSVQWYYKEMKPFVHYIPVKKDMSDLVERIEWAKTHDEDSLKISKNSQELAQKVLNHSDVMYYLYLLLKGYAKLQ